MKTLLRRLLLIGLPGTGKTTFLAALWHAVESNEIPVSLSLAELDGDRDYLNKIRLAWAGCRPLDRTQVGAEKIVSMRLTDHKGTRIAEVMFPDMSGESFRNQWITRQWTKSYSDLLQDATGALLFVHPETVVEPIRIDEADKLIAELPNVAEQEDDDSHDSWIPWMAKETPTQVQLVELLQFLGSNGHAEQPLRIGVIVSAWDLVAGDNQTPTDWLNKRLPLLAQFLKSNFERFPSRTYGISAQGGDLQTESDRLLRYSPQTMRILVEGPFCESHDITAPVAWLMGDELD